MEFAEVALRPEVVVPGRRLPDDAAVEALHAAAHRRCDIGNSIRGEVRVEGSFATAG